MSNKQWKAEADLIPGCLVLSHPDYGFVTVDLDRRIFSPGMGKPRSYSKGVGYSGKGWKDRLINDAKVHLAGIWSAA